MWFSVAGSFVITSKVQECYCVSMLICYNWLTMPPFPLLGGAADSFGTVLIHKLGQLMEQACSFDAQRYCLAVRENSVRLHADGVRARSAL
jgi:hypothetical protein